MRGDELIERVGLTDAADRKVGGYSGGMKRRLDLALALVHQPRLLFLDEPTTGLDPQSRTALWDEVARLAREDGVTVFLTTQYLEEADVLADRVGIIDRGKIVATGHAGCAEGGDRPPVGRGRYRPTAPAQARSRCAELLGRFGATRPAARTASPCSSTAVERPGRGRARARFGRWARTSTFALHQPSLDDVFLAKTGRSLDVDETPEEVAA